MSIHSDRSDLLSMSSKMQEALTGQIAKTIAVDIGDKYADYNCMKRSNKLKIESYRHGPIPIEECLLTKTAQAATYGTLDSECEELDFEDIRIKNANSTAYNKIRLTSNDKGDSIASCRAMIVYFSKLAKAKDEEEVIDLSFVEHLFDSGADINFPDKHGQTILHEVSRGWHPDVAKFMLEQGAEINKADGYGRTPLHLAAAVDYGEMVEFLIENGADLGRETFDEGQTAMHYAAKNNAADSLKSMLRLGGRINDRDYKRRTPLFVAAETARAESARFLIEQGAPCGVYDSSGTPLLSLLIEKMPQIAMDAIEQFHFLDRAFRKHYYYLGSLELDPVFLGEKIPELRKERKEMKARNKAKKKMLKYESGEKKELIPKCYARTPLEVCVQYEQMDLIMHPVFQRLLYVKWNLFGKTGSTKLLVVNFIYTLIWTVLGILLPRDGSEYYSPLKDNWWRIILEACGVFLTAYFIFCEITQVRSGERRHNYWRHWRIQYMEKDLKFCHPRWPEEEKYLRSELESIRSYQRTYFRDPWNIFEWVTYVVICVLMLTRTLSLVSNNATAKSIHPRVYAIGLVVIWLRFMRSCRAFRTLGPFIAILGSVINDTLKFMFLFFEFFIPYTVGFWILFGGRTTINDKGVAERNLNWYHFHDLMFSIWSMTLMGSFDWNGLVAIDRLMAQILCGTFYALAGVVCMNLYIALLSDTFARVYAYAQANAVMQQAKTIIILENNLSKYNQSRYGYYMQEQCSPQEVYTVDDTGCNEDRDQGMFDRVSRNITNRIDELDDSLKRYNKPSIDSNILSPKNISQVIPSHIMEVSAADSTMLLNFIQEQYVHNSHIRSEVEVLRNNLTEIKLLLINANNNSNNRCNSNNNNTINSNKNSNSNNNYNYNSDSNRRGSDNSNIVRRRGSGVERTNSINNKKPWSPSSVSMRNLRGEVSPSTKHNSFPNIEHRAFPHQNVNVNDMLSRTSPQDLILPTLDENHNALSQEDIAMKSNSPISISNGYVSPRERNQETQGEAKDLITQTVEVKSDTEGDLKECQPIGETDSLYSKTSPAKPDHSSDRLGGATPHKRRRRKKNKRETNDQNTEEEQMLTSPLAENNVVDVVTEPTNLPCDGVSRDAHSNQVVIQLRPPPYHFQIRESTDTRQLDIS